MAERARLVTHGLKDARAKLAKYKEKIEEYRGRLKAKEKELQKLREEQADNPPPPEFSQKWASRSRLLTRAQVSAEREASEFRQLIVGAEKTYKGQLLRLEEEAALQLAADKTWWSKRREEYLRRSKAARDSDVRLKVNPILSDLRLNVVDDATALKVREALETTMDPEV